MVGQVVYTVWDGDAPDVPATAFLRGCLDNNIESTTVRLYAYAVLSFLRFLRGRFESKLSFWDVEIVHVRWYNRELQRRTRLPKDHPRFLQVTTANLYLYVTESFWTYWFGPPPLERDGAKLVRMKGVLSHLVRRSKLRNPAFEIRVPMKDRNRRRHGVSVEAHDLIWTFLERGAPADPNCDPDEPGLTPGALTRAEDAEFAYLRRRMLHLRNLGVWGFLLASGCRLGELVRARGADLNQVAVPSGKGRTELEWFHEIVDHPEDRYLGSLKCGERRVFVGHASRYLRHVLAWVQEGVPLAREIRRRTGVPDHPLLFSNRDGGPLTKGAVYELFNRIDDGLGLTESRLVRDWSPHIARHTIATFMVSGDVPLVVVQKFLGHKHSSTTDRYVGHLQAKFRRALNGWMDRLDRLATADANDRSTIT